MLVVPRNAFCCSRDEYGLCYCKRSPWLVRRSSAAFCGWRNLCQLKATQEEQYALEKLLPFQRRFVFRCLAQWRRLVRIKQAGRALATRRAFRETTRRFSLWGKSVQATSKCFTSSSG